MKLLSLARDLKRRKARERQSLFVAEGVRAVEELLRSSIAIRGVLVAPQLDEAPRGRALREALRAHGVALAEVDHREFASAADTESPQGVLAVAEAPRPSLAMLPDLASARFIILDAVQDPGNVGTIIRTAAALGASAVLALPGTVDLWNAKVIRSAMGAQFHLPVLSSTFTEIDAFLVERGIPLWAADGAGDPVASVTRPGLLALAVGNEGAGLGDDVRKRAERFVSIPISPAVESLNVAVATGILLHALRP